MIPSAKAQSLRKKRPDIRTRNSCALVIIGLSAFVWTSGPVSGAPGESALETINQFLAESAATVPAYRADLQRCTDLERATDGRMAGFSPLIGPFTYRPKKYAELTQIERIGLLRDGRFHDYLLKEARLFPVNPEDMLTPQPLIVQLDPP
ncbi:MAG: hypothetical protein ABSA05_07670 [Opitutaceae bacterium]|jgi:hypothetical protein